MPATAVNDVLVLAACPRTLHPVATRFRTVHGLTTAPCGYEGDSFPVRRIP